MDIGISSFVWVSPFSTENRDIILKAKEIGYDLFEVAVEDKSLIDFGQIKKYSRELDIKLSVSGAFGAERDISSDNPEFRKIGLQYIKDCVDIAHDFESPIFGGPLYSAVGKTRLVSDDQKYEERMWCLENLDEATAYAKSKGITLALEPLNRFETDMINTLDQAADLIGEINDKNLRLLLDTFHANIEEKHIEKEILKYGDLIVHIQGNENDRGTPGTGHLSWDKIKAALAEVNYQGAIVLETFGSPSKELARAASIWRPLAESADILAQECFEFYYQQFKS
jgi:D-psicose/D-tagatose/L-ribulose 3-epimerase